MSFQSSGESPIDYSTAGANGPVQLMFRKKPHRRLDILLGHNDVESCLFVYENEVVQAFKTQKVCNSNGDSFILCYLGDRAQNIIKIPEEELEKNISTYIAVHPNEDFITKNPMGIKDTEFDNCTWPADIPRGQVLTAKIPRWIPKPKGNILPNFDLKDYAKFKVELDTMGAFNIIRSWHIASLIKDGKIKKVTSFDATLQPPQIAGITTERLDLKFKIVIDHDKDISGDILNKFSKIRDNLLNPKPKHVPTIPSLSNNMVPTTPASNISYINPHLQVLPSPTPQSTEISNVGPILWALLTSSFHDTKRNTLVFHTSSKQYKNLLGKQQQFQYDMMTKCLTEHQNEKKQLCHEVLSKVDLPPMNLLSTSQLFRCNFTAAIHDQSNQKSGLNFRHFLTPNVYAESYNTFLNNISLIQEEDAVGEHEDKREKKRKALYKDGRDDSIDSVIGAVANFLLICQTFSNIPTDQNNVPQAIICKIYYELGFIMKDGQFKQWVLHGMDKCGKKHIPYAIVDRMKRILQQFVSAVCNYKMMSEYEDKNCEQTQELTIDCSQINRVINQAQKFSEALTDNMYNGSYSLFEDIPLGFKRSDPDPNSNDRGKKRPYRGDDGSSTKNGGLTKEDIDRKKSMGILKFRSDATKEWWYNPDGLNICQHFATIGMFCNRSDCKKQHPKLTDFTADMCKKFTRTWREQYGLEYTPSFKTRMEQLGCFRPRKPEANTPKPPQKEEQPSETPENEDEPVSEEQAKKKGKKKDKIDVRPTKSILDPHYNSTTITSSSSTSSSKLSLLSINTKRVSTNSPAYPQKKNKPVPFVEPPSLIPNSELKEKPVPKSNPDNIQHGEKEVVEKYKELKRNKERMYFDAKDQNTKITSKYNIPAIVNFNDIHDKLTGKKPKIHELICSQKFGKPNLNQSFTTRKTIHNVLLPVFKSGFMNENDYDKISENNMIIEHMLIRLGDYAFVDFTDLNEIDTKYAGRTEIPPEFVDKYTACSLYYDLHLGSVMRYMGNNYTNGHIDVTTVLERCKGIVPPDILNDLERLLTLGTPGKLQATMSHTNVMEYYKYGNHSSIDMAPEKMKKVLLKEFKNQWIFLLPIWLSRWVPDAFFTPQGLLQKWNKKDRPIFDASHLLHAFSICLNMLVDTKDEPEIHYGETLMNILVRLWNLRITYADEELYMFPDDIKGAFRWGKYNPETVPAFCYTLFGFLIVSLGQNFGTVFAPANFEPIARAREILAEYLFHDKTLVEKHKDLLDMIVFHIEPMVKEEIATANKDKYNPGVNQADGTPRNTPHHTFVDDNVISDILSRMRQALAAGFEALFIILGYPDISKRQSPVAMDKLTEQPCSRLQTCLGYQIDTRGMTIMRKPESIARLHEDLSKWTNNRRSYNLKELNSIIGRIEDMGTHIIWSKILLFNMRNSSEQAKKQNAKKIYANPRNAELIRQSRYTGTDPVLLRLKNFALGKLQKALWNHKQKHFINRELRQDINLALEFTNNRHLWKVPIAHIVPREPDFITTGDACLEAGGGWSTDLLFWWYIKWPQAVVHKTLKFRFEIEPGVFITINLLEYLVVIINFAGATYQFFRFKAGEILQHMILNQPYPTIENFCDNTAAVKWTTKACRSNRIGKALSRFMAALTFGNPLGPHSSHISGDDNFIADSISRFDSHLVTQQFVKLLQVKPELANCQRLYPTHKLFSIIECALLYPEKMTLEIQTLNVMDLFSLDKDSSSYGVGWVN